MNTEELKMVLETIGQLGAAGKEAFIVWLAAKYGFALIQAGMVLCGILGLPWMITRCILKYGKYADELREIAKLCGLSSSEYQGYDCIRPEVIRIAVERKLSK